MPKFQEMLAGVTKEIDSLIKPDMSTEQISQIASIKASVQALEQPYKDIEQEAIKSKEKYIEVVTTFGTPKAPVDENVDNGKTMEKCIEEVVAQRKS